MESIKPTMFEPAAANIVAGWVTEGKAQLCKEKNGICSAFSIVQFRLQHSVGPAWLKFSPGVKEHFSPAPTDASGRKCGTQDWNGCEEPATVLWARINSIKFIEMNDDNLVLYPVTI